MVFWLLLESNTTCHPLVNQNYDCNVYVCMLYHRKKDSQVVNPKKAVIHKTKKSLNHMICMVGLKCKTVSVSELYIRSCTSRHERYEMSNRVIRISVWLWGS